MTMAPALLTSFLASSLVTASNAVTTLGRQRHLAIQEIAGNRHKVHDVFHHEFLLGDALAKGFIGLVCMTCGQVEAFDPVDTCHSNPLGRWTSAFRSG